MKKRKSIVLAIFAFFFPCMASAQTPVVKDVLVLATARYVRLDAYRLGITKAGKKPPTSDLKGNGTGFRIGGDYVLTNNHMLEGGVVLLADKEKIQAQVVKFDKKNDLALLLVAFPYTLPWITIADPHVGETVYGFSNAGGNDGFFVHHWVSEVSADSLQFQEPTIPGESGTGYLNEEGELVGMACKDATAQNEGTMIAIYSNAIPASVIRAFLKGIVPEPVPSKLTITPAWSPRGNQ